MLVVVIECDHCPDMQNVNLSPGIRVPRGRLEEAICTVRMLAESKGWLMADGPESDWWCPQCRPLTEGPAALLEDKP